MENYKKITCISILMLICSGCAQVDKEEISADEEIGLNVSQKWSYHGKNGPDNWGSKYALCKTGMEQSPINLVTQKTKNTPKDLKFSYNIVPLVLLNNGHTIEAVAGNGGQVNLNGEVYNLLQIHYHTPSEHTQSGKNYPAEIHFVHKSKSGKILVVGVFIKEGKDNQQLVKIINNIPSNLHKKLAITGESINLAALLPENTEKKYSYSGSFTTPPCTEGVSWYVFKDPITLSKKNIDKFAKIYPENHRPVQPLNKRKIGM